MNKEFYKRLVDNPELINEFGEAYYVATKRKYLVERVLGCIRGIKDGKYKDFEKSAAEIVVDNLILRDLINVEKIEQIPINHT